MQDNTAAKARQDGADGPTAAEEFNDDALATMAEEYAAQADHLFRLSLGARDELLQRLVAREAKILDTPHWEGKVKPGPWHHVIEDPDRLRQRLAPLVDPDALAAAFVQKPPPPPGPPPIRVDQRGVNDLIKRGGTVAEIIDEERTSQQGNPTLELKRKPEAPAGKEMADGPGTLETS